MQQLGEHVRFLHSNADMAMGGSPFNTSFNIPNIRSSSIKIYIYGYGYNNQCTCFNNPAKIFPSIKTCI